MSEVLQIATLLSDLEPPTLAPPPVKLLDLTAASDWLDANGDGVRAIITNSLVGVPGQWWERLPNLGLVANIGAGLESIDLAIARHRRVRVTYTPNLLTSDVADFAIALILSLFRGVVAGDAFVRTGDWSRRTSPLGRSVSGKRAGIAGFGRIGQAVADRVSAFGMEVGYFGRRRRAEVGHRYFEDIPSLAEWADVLVAAIPGGAETERLLSAEVFRALGPHGYFVNVARGSVVDEASLLEALRDGRIAGAGLDVFAGEPAINPAFLSLPGVVLSPHVGSATVETRRAMAEHAFANVRAFLDGRVLMDEVFAPDQDID